MAFIQGRISFLVFILSIWGVGCARENQQKTKYYVISEDGAPLLAQAHDNAPVVITIPYGDSLQAIPEEGKNYWRAFYQGKEGFIAKDLIAEETSTSSIVYEEQEEYEQDTLSTLSKETPPETTATQTPQLTISEPTKKTLKKTIAANISERAKKKEQWLVSAPPVDTSKGAKKKKSILAQKAGASLGTLPTYGSGLEDLKVDASSLYHWHARLQDYTGTYSGPLGAPITEIKIQIQGHQLQGTLSYSIEKVNPMGLLDTEEGDAQVSFSPHHHHQTYKLTTQAPVTIFEGEFVEWEGNKGLLLHVKSTQHPYILLRKR